MSVMLFLPAAAAFWLFVILLALGLYGLAGAALISCGALVLLALLRFTERWIARGKKWRMEDFE